jgi:hypothetical protein
MNRSGWKRPVFKINHAGKELVFLVNDKDCHVLELLRHARPSHINYLASRHHILEHGRHYAVDAFGERLEDAVATYTPDDGFVFLWKERLVQLREEFLIKEENYLK